jgi:Lipopolysaccharide export system permease LptF/LptG
MTPGDCTRGTRLRRFAERTFDRSTFEHVIQPALADLQHECDSAGSDGLQRWRTSLRAYWGLWKTIGICTIGDVARNQDGISSSLGGRTAVFLPILVAILMLPSASWMVAFASEHGTASALTASAWLLPASILVALPAAFFFALAMFRTGADVPSTRLLPSTIAGSVVCAAVVFALLMVVVPTTNQAYRTHVFAAFQGELTNGPRIPLRKGLAEMTLVELNEHIRQPPSTRQAELARAHRQERFAFVGAVFVLALLGLGLAGRWRSEAATSGAAIAILVGYGVCFGFGAGLNTFGYPAAYGTWTANGAFLVIALRLLRSRGRYARV